MKPIGENKYNNIKALLQKRISIRKIASQTGVSMSKIGEIRRALGLDPSLAKQGAPKKMTEKDDRLAARLIRSGKVDTAVQVTQHLNFIVNKSLNPQTVRNHLKKMGMRSVVKKKKPRSLSSIKRLASTLQISTKNGQKTIGNKSYGLMSPRSTD